MEKLAYTLLLIVSMSNLFLFSQGNDIAQIKSTLLQYPAFQNCKLDVKADTANSGLYSVNISYGGKTINAETFKKDNEWLVVFDASKSFIANLVKDEAGELDSLQLNKGMFLVANSSLTLLREDIPDKYQISIKKTTKSEDGYINYELSVEKGFNIIGEATSTHLKILLSSTINTDYDTKLIMNTSLGNDLMAIITGGKTADKSYLSNLQIDLFAYNYLPKVKDDTVTFSPLNLIFRINGSGFSATLQTTATVKGITFFGFSSESFLLKGVFSINPDFNIPQLELTGLKAFNKNNIVAHIPTIKLSDLGLTLYTFPDKNKNGDYSFNLNFIGKVKWESESYDVTFPKEEKSGNYRVEFASLPLSKFYPNFNSVLLKDLFSNMNLENVYLSNNDYFDAKLPFNGGFIDITGFKMSGNSEYNIAFHFPNLNIKNLLNHEAGFSFPDINLPHNVIAFYIPEINLPQSNEASSQKRTLKIPSLNSIPSLKFQSFFNDYQGYSFPKNGFELSYGLSFEHFDITLSDLFSNHFPDMEIQQYLGNIKLKELNITTKTISCKIPINTHIDIDLIAFKVPNSPKLNLIFQIDNFDFKDYISGISGTPLADISSIKNIKFIDIPTFTTSTSMAGNKKATSLTLNWSDLPNIVKFSFPEYSEGSNGSIKFATGFNFYAPTPTFNGNLKAFLDAINCPDFPVIKGSINPKFLFQNWSSWNLNLFTSSSSNTPAKNNPQVPNDNGFRDDFAFKFSIPNFSVSNISVKDANLSLDGLKFNVPIKISNQGKISKTGKKLFNRGEIAALITANIELKMSNDKNMKLHETRFLFDQQNNVVRFTTTVSEDSLIYAKNKDGKKEVKETIPTTLFTTENMNITEIGFEGMFNYQTKETFAYLYGALFLHFQNNRKHFDFDAKLHYNHQEKEFIPLFHIFSEEGLTFSIFNNLSLPEPLNSINYLLVYDIEIAENYFFLGFSPENTIEQNLDSSEYIIAFKAKGQSKFNLGVRSTHLITTLLHDAPNSIRTDAFHNEKFIYIPAGNNIQGLSFEGYPDKIAQHFNPKNLPTINLTVGKTIQARYTGEVEISDFQLQLTDLPVGFNISSTSSGNNNSVVDGMEIMMILPDFTFEGVDFKSDTMILAKEDGNWNTTMHTQIAFDYQGKNYTINVDAQPFITDSSKGIVFSSTNNMIFDLPQELNYATYDNVSIHGTIERTHNITDINLSGDLHLGSSTYTTTAQLLKEDGKYKDIVFKLTGAPLQIADIPEINKLPDADKISITNPEISLHHIAGQFTYDNFSTSGIIFRDQGNVALILGFDNFGLHDIISDVPSDFSFGQSTIVLSSGNINKTINDLPIAVQFYFTNFYSSNDDITFPGGLSLFSKFNPAKLGGNVGTFFTNIGMNEDFAISGGLGLNLSGISNFTLYVSPKNEVKTKGNFAFISNVKEPKFYISYQPGTLGMGLEAKTHIKIDKELLSFQVKLGINYSVETPIAIKMQSSMLGEWRNPMGLNGLAFKNVTMGMEGNLDAGLNIDFTGTLQLKSDTLFLSSTLPANGNLSQFAICATATNLSSQAYANLADALMGGKLHIDEIPMSIINFKDVELAFVPPFAAIHCSDKISGINGGGIALKGKAELGGDIYGATYQVGEINATAGLLSGMSIKGNLNDVDLHFTSVNNAKLDIVAKLEDGKPKTHFKLNGDIMLLGETQSVEMDFSPNGITFEYDYGITDLFSGKVTAKTSNGIHFSKDDTLYVSAELSGDLQDDFLNALGEEVSAALTKLDDGYDALKQDLQTAINVVSDKENEVDKVRNKILKERQKIENELNEAQHKVDELSQQIRNAKNAANKNYNDAKNGCKHSHKYCWKSFWGKKYCYTFHWVDWSCRAEHYAIYLEKKSEQLTFEAAKYTANKLLEAIKSSIKFVPIEADPRMAVPLAELETAKGGMNLAIAALEGAQHANDELADLSKEIKTPDIIKDNFYLKKVKLSGMFNAFQTQGNEIDFQLTAKVFGEDVETAFSITPRDVNSIKNNILSSLSSMSKHKPNAIKEKHSKEHYYQPSTPTTLTFYWKKLPGRLIDITATDNYIYGIGLDNKLYRLNISFINSDSTIANWTKLNKGIKVQRIAAKGNMVYTIGQNNAILEYNETTNSWTQYTTGAGQDIAAAPDGSVWIIGNRLPTAALYKTTDKGTNWTKTPAKAKRLDINDDGKIYHIGGDDQLWDSQQNKLIVAGKAKDVFALKDDFWIQSDKNEPWLYETNLYSDYVRANGKTQGLARFKNRVYSINSKDNSVWVADMPEMFTPWQKQDVKMLQVASNSSGVVWGIGFNYHAYKYNEQQNTWEDYGGTIKRISVQESGVPLGISAVPGEHNQIVYPDLTTKTWSNFGPYSNAYDLCGLGWHIGSDAYKNNGTKPSSIWAYTNNGYIQANGLAMRITSDDAYVYVIGGGPAVYYKDKTGITDGWTKISFKAKEIAVSPKREIWVIDKNNAIYRTNMQNHKFKIATGKAKSIAFTNTHMIVVGMDDYIWKIKY